MRRISKVEQARNKAIRFLYENRSNLDPRTRSSLETRLYNSSTVNKINKVINTTNEMIQNKTKSLKGFREYNQIQNENRANLLREQNAILDAGEAFVTEKHKFNEPTSNLISDYESRSGLDKNYLGDKYHMVEYDNDRNKFNFNIIEENHTLLNELQLKRKMQIAMIKRKETVGRKYQIKSYVTIQYKISHMEQDDKGRRRKVFEDRYFNSSTKDLTTKRTIEDFTEEIIKEFENSLSESKNYSDTVFEGILNIKVKTATNLAILGKSFIEFPTFIKNKKCCLNIKNYDDNKCFFYCLVAFKSVDFIKRNDKSDLYNYKKYYNMIKEPDDIEYPIAFENIESFENLNDMKINVFECNEKEEGCYDVINGIIDVKEGIKNTANISGGKNKYKILKNLYKKI